MRSSQGTAFEREERRLGRALCRSSHLFADAARLREAGRAAAETCGDVTGHYLAVVAGLAVAYAHADGAHERTLVRHLQDAAEGEPAMLEEAGERVAELDVLAAGVRARAARLLELAGDGLEATDASAAAS